jgi:hypothetical protein
LGLVLPAHRSRSESIAWSEMARAVCTVPETLEEVTELAKSILHRKRDFWIVVLTARRLESKPAMSPIAVREIVGPNAPIVFLRSSLATHLSTLLPPKTHVFGGAVRVYRPGVTDDPWGHPLLYDPSGEYGDEILDWLGRIFTPSVARPPRLSAEERVLVLDAEVKRLAQARARDLDVVRGRYEAHVLGGGRSEPARRRWNRFCGLGSARRELGGELRRLISAHWHYMPRDERAAHPLRDYRFTRQFLTDVRSRVGKVPLDRVAWVCAFVACGFDVSRVGLAAGPLRPVPDAPQLTRADGARAWWCDLRRSPSRHNPRVVYWCATEGSTELVALGYPTHDAIGQRV